jgi:peptide deformylase
MILKASQLPNKIYDTPTDDLIRLYKVGQEMRELCSLAHGKGLSAVQVGIPWKFFIVADLPNFLRINDDPFGYFVNCEYEAVGDRTFESVEGCLSLLAEDGSYRRFRLTRNFHIRVIGQRLVDLTLCDFDQVLDIHTDAIVFAHEIDHHRGILISDKGKEILLW